MRGGWGGGPLNVPDYPIHRYTASGAQTDSRWIAPGGGTIYEGADTSDIRIFWGSGPVVGKAVYQATSHYLRDLEVNVVQVVVETPIHAFMTYPSTNFQTNVENIAYKIVFPGNPYGLAWRTFITLNGPVSERGVDRMQIGFVQNMVAYQNVGIYRTEEVKLIAVMEHDLPLVDKLAHGIARAWYSMDDTATFFDDSSTNKSKTLSADDTPYDGPPLTSSMGSWPPDASDDVVGDILVSMGFALDVCSCTLDTQNSAHEIYTRRATANWSFNGDCRIYQLPPTYPWTFPANWECVTAPDHWGPVENGSVPARVDGITANESLATVVFNQENWESAQ